MDILKDELKSYKDKVQSIKTIGEFKQLGRELRDEFNLTDIEAIQILNQLRNWEE